jgi:IS605 OrfB family transposase
METYTRTVQFETPVLTAKKAGLLNRAMKDYRRARAYACRYFQNHDPFDFSYSDRESLRKRISRQEDVNLPARTVYPVITTVEQNYKEYEKDESADEPQANRADTLALEGQNARIFYDDGYYLNVNTGPKSVNVPLDVSDDAWHQDRLPRPEYIPAKESDRQRRCGVKFEDLEPGNFPKDTVKLSTSTMSNVGERRYVANLVFKIKKRMTQDVKPEDARYVVGVDRGRNVLAYAALYDRENDHVESWWSRKGDEVQHYMDRFSERIREFQEAGVWEKMEEARKRRLRYKEQVDYEIANRVVELAREKMGGAIVLEELSNMSRLGDYGKENRRFSEWSYYRLGEIIKQKAEPYDIPVKEIEPSYTSQDCSRCGSEDTDRGGVHFRCNECGYDQHADANAAVNIAKRV